MIEIEKLSKDFETFRRLPGIRGTIRSFVRREWIVKTALQEVSARIEPGELVGILGANGAGKTTLVKILSGIVHPSRGDARVLGERPWLRSREFRASISLVMGQKAQLWWDLTPADSFELLREIYRIPAANYRRNLDSLRQWLSVGDQIHTPVRRLSLGERMKMELIAALLHDPKVIFLDEPTIGLDINAQNAMREFLSLYRRERKPIILLTSHYMKDIEALCERIILIHGGRFVYDGSLRQALQGLHASRTLRLELERPVTPEEVEARLGAAANGTWKLPTPQQLDVALPRETARTESARILDLLPTRDFTLEDEDIGDTLGRWIASGGAPRT
jgi:ABC-2 type transport system ATP-binding protein